MSNNGAAIHRMIDISRSATRSLLNSVQARRRETDLTEVTEQEHSANRQWSDREITLASMAELTTRAVDALAPDHRSSELPNPLITTDKLSHNLQLATDTQAEVRSAVTTSSRATLLHPAADRQAVLDEALIHCLHQLDHRSKAQDQRIIDLEAQLAEASRRIIALESGAVVAR